MDFNSLGAGSPFYIHTKHEGQKPTLEVGVVKEKVAQQPQYQLQAVPGAMNGLGNQQLFRFVVTINGNDKVVADLPANVEIASKGNETYSGNPQAMLQVVDAMMQKSRGELEREAYNKMVLEEGERQVEILNPRYAEEKQRDRAIKALEQRQVATDSKLDKILSRLDEFFAPSKK